MTTVRDAVAAALAVAARRSRSLSIAPSRTRVKVTYAAALSMLTFGAVAAAQDAPPAQAQAAGAAANAQPVQLEEVTVTGSRIKRTTDFNTPTPTTVVDSATMESMGLVNVGQTLTLTPANISTFTPAATGNSPYFIGAYIPDLRGLNPYFGSRTLTLVNGQRFVQTEQGDQIDLNFIPQILVQRVDVVTGGASAAYGSGAIAGVENVILDDKLEGGKLQGDWYETSHSDAKDRHVGAAYGHGLFDNRLHFVLAGEYENQDALGCETARSWCAQNQGAYQTNLGAPGVATYGYGTNIRGNYSSYTGVILPNGTFPVPFGPASAVQGTPTGNGTMPYAQGLAPYSTAPGSFNNDVPGGQGVPIYQYANLMAPVNRGIMMGMLNGSITDYLNFKTSLYWGKVETTNYQGTVGTTGGYIAPDNAYIQGIPSLETAIDPTGAYINKDWTSQLQSYSQFSTNVRRVTFGLDGKIGDSSWTWDANYEYGLTHHDQLLANNLHLYEADMALDSVIGPNGQPECRVTADGFAGAVAANPFGGYAGANPALAQGCVPINPFGNLPLSQAQEQYVFGNLVENLRYEQTDANINASGNYFRGVGAGPFSAAVGYEYRQELGDNLDNPGVPLYIAQDYLTQFGQSFGGIVTVHEGYLETNIPLLKNEPGANLLEFDLAGRESRYENRALFGIDTSTPGVEGTTFSHDLTTWKASGIWEPVDGFRIRASQSRDARAPNFRELYYGQVIGAGGIFGYCGPSGTFSDPCTWNLEGNVNLRPETSDTTTAGIVITPRDLLPGFQFSADWFHIKINNAIEQANPTLVLQGCKLGIAEYCNQITFLPGTGGAAAYQALSPTAVPNIEAITPTSYNGAFYEVRGIDFSLNYIADLGSYGTVSTRVLTTWMDQQDFANCTVPGVQVCRTYSILGQTGTGNNFLPDYTPDAKWRGTLMVTWSQGPLSITPSMNYVSHGVMDYLGVTPSDPMYAAALKDPTLGLHPMSYNYVPSYFLFNLNGTYSFANVPSLKGLQLFVQVNNVFNKTPPFTGGATGFGPSNAYGGTNPIFFDTLGLAYRVGFRLTF